MKPLLTKCVHDHHHPRRSWPALYTPLLLVLVDVVIESVTKLVYICGTGMMVCVCGVNGGRGR